MGYATVDDLLPHHKKLIEAGPDAPAIFGWYVAALCFAQRQRTDGFIARANLGLLLPGGRRPTKRHLTRLVGLKLWDEAGADGWWIHDYLEHNASAAQRRGWATANRLRQARHRDRVRHAVTNAVTNTVTNAPRNAVTNALVTPRTSTTRKEGKNLLVTREIDSSRARVATRVPDQEISLSDPVGREPSDPPTRVGDILGRIGFRP